MQNSYKRLPRYRHPSPKSKRMKRLLLLLFMVLLLYIFIGGDYGLYEIYHLRKKTSELKREKARLLDEQNRLIEKKNNLEQDLGYIEKVARENYGMIKKGEIVYEVVPEKGERK